MTLYPFTKLVISVKVLTVNNILYVLGQFQWHPRFLPPCVGGTSQKQALTDVAKIFQICKTFWKKE